VTAHQTDTPPFDESEIAAGADILCQKKGKPYLFTSFAETTVRFKISPSDNALKKK
jgi:hypothetical protein